jgi:hypothetical protein
MRILRGFNILSLYSLLQLAVIAYLISLRFIVRAIYIILNSNSPIYIYRASSILSNSFSSRLYGTLVFLLPN